LILLRKVSNAQISLTFFLGYNAQRSQKRANFVMINTVQLSLASLKPSKSSGWRLTLWWLLGGFLWILVGGLLFSLEWGLYLGLYCFAGGPILAVLGIGTSLRFRLWGLAKYRHDAGDEITKSVLKWHLRSRGPRPEIWIYPSTQVKVFLIPDILRISRKQHVVISHAFLRLTRPEQHRYLESLWKKMAALQARGLRLYAGRLLAWFAVLSPLVFFVETIDRVQSLILGRRLHEVSEWVQPLFFKLKELLVGGQSNNELYLGASRHPLNLIMGFWDETLNDAEDTGNSAQRELKPNFNELR
jgi:hypothetical protein